MTTCNGQLIDISYLGLSIPLKCRCPMFRFIVKRSTHKLKIVIYIYVYKYIFFICQCNHKKFSWFLDWRKFKGKFHSCSCELMLTCWIVSMNWGKKATFCLATTTETKCAETGEIRHLMPYSFQDPVLLLVPPARVNDRHWNDTSRKPFLLVFDCFGRWMYLSTVDYSICFDRASLLESHCSCLQTSNVHTQHAQCITSIPLWRGEFTGWGIYRLIQVPSKPTFWPCTIEWFPIGVVKSHS